MTVVTESALKISHRIAEEKWFSAADGVELFYRHWPGKSQRAVVLFHRGHEHSGRLQDVVDSLDMPDFHCFAWMHVD